MEVTGEKFRLSKNSSLAPILEESDRKGKTKSKSMFLASLASLYIQM